MSEIGEGGAKDSAPARRGARTDSYDTVATEATVMDEDTAEAGNVTARYFETDAERLLAFDRDGATAAIAQNLDGYAMLKVLSAPEGEELERYYGFDVALDHAAEVLGLDPGDLPVPDPARDMGM